jgi:Carboxypeptidase regulatory-like domain/TonB dependent receptor
MGEFLCQKEPYKTNYVRRKRQMNTATLRLGVILLCLASLGENLRAQGLTAAILGRVFDQSGAVIPGARVTAINAAIGYRQESISNESGFFKLPALPTGVYSLEASMQGFGTLKQGPITLSTNQQMSVDLTLSPGAMEQTIEVVGQAQSLQTQDASVNSKIYLDQIQNLPLNSRSPYELALMAPSTQISRQQSGPAMQLTINGQNANGFKLMFDGMEAGIGGDAQYWAGNNFNLSVTSLDAVQEYDIATGNYSADIKGSSGYVNFVSKTGTNQLHGSFYDFFRNGALDARNFFHARKQSLKQNDFGGTIAGPIMKDKLFFMGSYEGQRIRYPLGAFPQVPTASFRARVDPRLRPFLDLTPLPTEPIPGDPDRGIWRGNPKSVARQDLFTTRVDMNFSAKDRVFVQYTFNEGVLNGATLDTRVAFQNVSTIYPGFVTRQPERHQTATLGWTRTFSPTFLSDFKIGVNRFLQGRVRGPADEALFNIPVVTVPGFVMGGGGNKKKLGNTQPQLSEKATWIKGRHTLSFGGNYVFLQSGQNQFSVISMSFPSLAAFAANSPATISSTFGTSLTQRGEHISYHQKGLFIQEDFRATPSLTLNIGLRYDNYGRISDSTCNAKNVISGPFDAFRAPCAPLHDVPHNFGPRVGFAWKPSSKSPFVVRGGYGIFFGTHVSGQLGDVLAINNSLPFTLTTADYPDLSYPFAPELLARANATPGRFVFDPDTDPLYTNQWNLTTEYQFSQSTVFTLGYVGNHSVNVPGTQFPNAVDPLIGRRPNTNFGVVRVVANEDSTMYHSLQASVRRRLTNNLSFDGYYAWSHATGVQSGQFEISAAVSFGAEQIQTFKNRALSRGTLPVDVTHNFSANLVYQLPKLANANAVVRNVFGGWTTSGLVKTSTGLPFNIITGGDTGDLTFTQRPNRVPGVPLTLSGVSPADGFINRAAFTVPTAVDPATGLRLGNLANNVVRMPATFVCDWMVGKRLVNSETLNLDFRAEFFNMLNHPVFAFPQASLASGTAFGRSTSASDGRQIQLSLRFSF